jgi:uncharacterized DUF497 family protein
VQRESFSWDEAKDLDNRVKHSVSFAEAQLAFFDPQRVIAKDLTHSSESEARFYCFGSVADKIMTVRFTYRDNVIRIIGAGYWRKGKRIYEQKNKVS